MVRLVVSVGAWEGTPTRGRGTPLALVEARPTLLLVSATTTLACESLLLHHLLLLLLSLLFIEPLGLLLFQEEASLAPFELVFDFTSVRGVAKNLEHGTDGIANLCELLLSGCMYNCGLHHVVTVLIPE